MTRLQIIAVAFGIVAAQGCNTSKSHKAADKVVDRQADLSEERKDLGDKKVDEIKETKGVVKKSGDLADATADFKARRQMRVDELRAEHQVIGTQPLLISTMAQAFPLTDAGRTDVNEKLQVLQMRLDQTANMINGLGTSTAKDYNDRDDAIGEAMSKLDDARKAAWKALDDARRTDRSS